MSNKIVLVTGGSRSGKSCLAESLCSGQNNSTAYIATSIPFDEEMADRVKKHREQRSSEWDTYEIYKDVHKEIQIIGSKYRTVILDCITLLVNNLMFDYSLDIENMSTDEIDKMKEYIYDQIEKLMAEIRNTDLYFVFVTNELGMGVMPDNKLSRIYTDIAGKVNQYIAKMSDEVFFVVSGIPMKIKG
nr:bifunctional adenosylcobinamide kinase/adenosylcobinamide-phosphate guanylyltransferase [Clostridioides sp.]